MDVFVRVSFLGLIIHIKSNILCWPSNYIYKNRNIEFWLLRTIPMTIQKAICFN